MLFKDLDISPLKTKTKTFTYNGQEIAVKDNLSVKQEIDFVDAVLQHSDINYVYNQGLVEMYFHLYLFALFTDVDFTDVEQDDGELYDLLVGSGLMSAFLAILDKDTYKRLYDMVEAQEKVNLKYRKPIIEYIQQLLRELPNRTEEIQKLLSGFSPEQYKQVMELAKSVGFNG